MKLGDEELMAMFKAGVREALDMLYERYRGPIYGLAYQSMGNREDAEDVLQDVFFSVARSSHHYQNRGRFKSWLFEIAANRIRSFAGRRNRIARIELPETSSPGSRIDTKTGIDEQIDDRNSIQKALELLNPDQRLILILKEVEGFKLREIAESMGISYENVRVKLHRARARLLAASDLKEEITR